MEKKKIIIVGGGRKIEALAFNKEILLKSRSECIKKELPRYHQKINNCLFNLNEATISYCRRKDFIYIGQLYDEIMDKKCGLS